jgi:CRP/FNR family transcriptional regulator
MENPAVVARKPATVLRSGTVPGASFVDDEAGGLASAGYSRPTCIGCGLRATCVPSGLPAADYHWFTSTLISCRRLRNGEPLYEAGDRLEALYAVRAGFFKTSVLSEEGGEQVTGFQMTGDILGLDGIDTGYHTGRTTALDHSEVCVISYAGLMQSTLASQPLQHCLYRILGREIVRDHSMMLLLGSMRAEERVVAFLLNLSLRMQARGYSASEFRLRMSREDVGSFLGLKLETVSRTLSGLRNRGLIDVQRRHIEIRDRDGLADLIGR